MGGKQEPLITTYNATDNRECKAKTTFTTWLVNLKYVTQLKLSGSPNNIKSGINN